VVYIVRTVSNASLSALAEPYAIRSTIETERQIEQEQRQERITVGSAVYLSMLFTVRIALHRATRCLSSRLYITLGVCSLYVRFALHLTVGYGIPQHLSTAFALYSLHPKALSNTFALYSPWVLSRPKMQYSSHGTRGSRPSKRIANAPPSPFNNIAKEGRR
jgi:hypothetical protein